MVSTARALILIGLLCATAVPAGAAVVTFDNLVLGEQYAPGDSFVSGDTLVTVEAFEKSNGTVYNGGYAEVQNGGKADGSGLEVWTNNANLDFDFGGAVYGISFQFGEYGGNLNFQINDEFRNLDSLSGVDDRVVGGADVHVVGPYNGLGSVHITSTNPIHTFKVGGQEFVLDNIIACVPEPMMLGVLGVGALVLLRRRRA